MLNRIGPEIVHGKKVREASFNAVAKMAEIVDWRVGWILNQMKTRNISQTSLAKLMGTTRQSVGNNVFHTTATSTVFRYAATYVLQHMYYDTELKDWVLID